MDSLGIGPKISSGLIVCWSSSARARLGDCAHRGRAAFFASCASSSSESEYSESTSGSSMNGSGSGLACGVGCCDLAPFCADEPKGLVGLAGRAADADALPVKLILLDMKLWPIIALAPADLFSAAEGPSDLLSMLERPADLLSAAAGGPIAPVRVDDESCWLEADGVIARPGWCAFFGSRRDLASGSILRFFDDSSSPACVDVRVSYT